MTSESKPKRRRELLRDLDVAEAEVRRLAHMVRTYERELGPAVFLADLEAVKSERDSFRALLRDVRGQLALALDAARAIFDRTDDGADYQRVCELESLVARLDAALKEGG